MRDNDEGQSLCLPDLLQFSPQLRIDEESTDLAIVMAFSGGTAGALFADALEKATIPQSSWQPESYAADLFLKKFVTTSLQISLGGAEPVMVSKHLVRIVGAPPSDVSSVSFRREIVAELISSPPMRRSLENVYRKLSGFRAQLEGTSSTGIWDANRRQLDILALLKDLVHAMQEGFSEARSGLGRLHVFARKIRDGEAFCALTDLLSYDDRLATVSFKMNVGADGRVRQLSLETLEENETNQFVSSPLRRWLAKIEMFLRGYRMSDGEVMARLLDAVFEGVRQELPPFIQLLGDLEFYLGALSFHDRATQAGLNLCVPELTSSDEVRVLRGLFNPLLLGHGVTPVPCDIVTDKHAATVLITGPNSGGKTRLLQSLGLAQLLAQSGLFVPAREATMALAPGLVVSLIQETHADQTEGRLGMELMRIRRLFEHLPPGALVILDELCSGTNPSEGEEIFELVIQMLTRLKPQAFITTHFLGFAGRLEREQKIKDLRFLQVALGADHEPTYQFAKGVATTSLASQAAARLGVTGEQLLSLVEKNIARSQGLEG